MSRPNPDLTPTGSDRTRLRTRMVSITGACLLAAAGLLLIVTTTPDRGSDPTVTSDPAAAATDRLTAALARDAHAIKDAAEKLPSRSVTAAARALDPTTAAPNASPEPDSPAAAEPTVTTTVDGRHVTLTAADATWACETTVRNDPATGDPTVNPITCTRQ